MIFLRTIALTIAFILLFNPILKFVRNKIYHPKVIILEDTSASMLQKGNEITKSELFATAKQKLSKKIKAEGFKLEIYNFANGLEGDNNNTNLSKSLIELNKKIEQKNLSAFFLLSDGWLKDENLNYLENLNTPINTFIPDFSYNNFDLEINNVKFSKSSFVEEIIPIYTQVKANDFTGSAQVQLLIDQDLAASQNVNFSQNNFIDLQFEHIFFQAGLHDLEVIISTDSLGEENSDNNRFPTVIQIRDNKLKCVVISDQLSWDENFLIKSMKYDENWETEYLNKTDKFYLQNEVVKLSEQIANANCLVVFNHENLKLSSTETVLIRNFISNGGGMLYFGKIIEPLQNLLPAQKANLNRSFEGQIIFMDESKKYQTFRWENANIPNNIPPINYFYTSAKLQAQIFARINNEQQSPAILFHEYEKGKVMYFSFLNLWKWQMWTEGNHYKKFIYDLISWFGQRESARISAASDKLSYFAGESVKINLQVFDEQFNPANNVNAVFKLYNDKNDLVMEDYFLQSADQLNLTINELTTGKYRYEITDNVSQLSTKGEFSVSDFNPETRDKGINDVLLNYIANVSGGSVYTDLDSFTLPSDNNVIDKIMIEIPIYTKWYLITLFLLCFCLELFLRKRWGML